MKIGFVGLGKLGFPCAVIALMRGRDVMGYDFNPAAMSRPLDSSVGVSFTAVCSKTASAAQAAMC